MKKLLMSVAVLATAVFANAQTPADLCPTRARSFVAVCAAGGFGSLFSIWSPYDKLNDGDTRHWTNDEKPLEGLLRVDGKTYRFMGSKERALLESIVPMADEAEWKAMYTRTNPGAGWEKPDFNASGWKEGTAAFGSPELSNVRTHWSEQNSDLYVRRSVELTADDLNNDLYLVYSHDDVLRSLSMELL